MHCHLLEGDDMHNPHIPFGHRGCQIFPISGNALNLQCASRSSWTCKPPAETLELASFRSHFAPGSPLWFSGLRAAVVAASTNENAALQRDCDFPLWPGTGICNIYEFLAYKHPHDVDEEAREFICLDSLVSFPRVG